jgi:GTP:adenosylcobinamide-phosphate guanylyltransferase
VSIDAVILGGGQIKGIKNSGAKSLLLVGGKPMLHYVVNALKKSKIIKRIIVILPSPVENQFELGQIDEIVIKNDTLSQNMLAGIKRLGFDNLVLVVSADIPLLTPQAIVDFVKRCETKEAKIFYPIIPRELAERCYPQMKRTYVKLQEGSFTGGNMVLVDPCVVRDNITLIERAFAARKNPVVLARALGFKFLVKFLFGRLSISEVEARVSEMLGAPCAGVVTPYCEIGMDVDKDSDLQLVGEVIAQGG